MSGGTVKTAAIHIPKRLCVGDTVGFIAPAGAIRAENGLMRAVEYAEAQGFRVKVAEGCKKVYGYLSGTDDVRANDVNRMFADEEVDAVFCVRGGYGAPRILPLLDYDMIAHNPKPFLGYSDITALHAALLQRCGLASYHGPMPASDWISEQFDPFSMAHLRSMLMEDIGGALVNPSGYEMETIAGGICEGMLVGGNLTLVSGLCGTPFDLDTRGKVLFLEDVGEKTYRLDHMLTQLRAAGKFDACAGIVFGDFADCPVEYPEFGLGLREIIRDIVAPCGKPILFGLRAGHCQPTLTLPLGMMCRLDADARMIDIYAA